MIVTVGAVIVNSDAFVDPRFDTSTPIIRDIFRRTAGARNSFEILAVHIVPQSEDDIRSAVRDMIRKSTLDLVLVVGGIGFEDRQCTPEVCPHHGLS